MALANNPTLVEAQARVDAAQGRWLQVGLKPNPVVGYSGQQLGSGGQAEQQGVYVGQEFIRGGKLELNRAVVEQEIARAEQELAAQHFRVLTDVRLAYYDFLIGVRRGDLAQTMLEYTKTIQDDTQKLLDGGEAKRSDLLRAQIEVRTIEIVMRDAEFQKQAAWKTLIAVLGNPDLETPSVNDAMRTDARMILAEAAQRAIDQQQQLDRILSSNPELSAAMANVEAARWFVDRARAEVVPDVDVQAIFQSDNGTNSSNMNLQVTLPIPIWNRNQGGIREAQAQVVEAERIVDRVTLRLIQRFEVVYQRYLNAKYQVEQYTKTGDTDKDKGILVKAQESIDLNQRLLRAGEIKNLEMFVAQQVYTQANLAYLDTVRELWASILEIEGLLLKNSLQAGPSR
jgi:cobalt-zinc-cadmium efflux system outer membrane protein